MRKLAHLVTKNMKLLLRARTSALIVILAPLLVIFLSGVAFDNANEYQVRLGTFTPQENELVNSFVGSLEESQFAIQKYTTQESCISGIKSGSIHTCLVFAEEFSINTGHNTISFYVDNSRINLVGAIMDAVSSQLSTRNDALSENLASAVVMSLDSIDKQVKDKHADVIALTTENNNVLKKVSAVQASLEALDLTFDSANLNKSFNISLKNNELDTELTQLRRLLEGLSANTSGSVKNSVDNALNDVTDIRDITDEIAILSADLAFEVGKLQSQLNSTNHVKQASLDDLSNAREVLDTSVSNIVSLQQGFTAMVAAIDGVEVKDAGTISKPIETIVKPVVTERTHLDYLFPILVALVVMFTSILLAPTLIQIEKKSSAYFRNAISPVHDATFIISTFITVFLILVVQVAIILTIGALAFKTFNTNMLSTILVTLVLIGLFTFLGMIVGYVFNSQETATLGGIFMGTLFLFLSDVILPLESMPAAVTRIASYNPFVLGSDLLRKTVVFNEPIQNMYVPFLVAIGFMIGLMVMSVATYKMNKSTYKAKKK